MEGDIGCRRDLEGRTKRQRWRGRGDYWEEGEEKGGMMEEENVLSKARRGEKRLHGEGEIKYCMEGRVT